MKSFLWVILQDTLPHHRWGTTPFSSSHPMPLKSFKYSMCSYSIFVRLYALFNAAIFRLTSCFSLNFLKISFHKPFCKDPSCYPDLCRYVEYSFPRNVYISSLQVNCCFIEVTFHALSVSAVSPLFLPSSSSPS